MGSVCQNAECRLTLLFDVYHTIFKYYLIVDIYPDGNSGDLRSVRHPRRTALLGYSPQMSVIYIEFSSVNYISRSPIIAAFL